MYVGCSKCASELTAKKTFFIPVKKDKKHTWAVCKLCFSEYKRRKS